MTTIAWDLNILAVDSRCTIGTDILNDNEVKLRKNVGIFSVVVVSGIVDDAWDYVNEVLYNISDVSQLPREPEGGYGVIGILKENQAAWCLTGSPPYQVTAPWAYGSGCDFAIAAMDHGKSAIDAVKYASTRDCWTNSKVRSYKVTKESKGNK